VINWIITWRGRGKLDQSSGQNLLRGAPTAASANNQRAFVPKPRESWNTQSFFAIDAQTAGARPAVENSQANGRFRQRRRVSDDDGTSGLSANADVADPQRALATSARLRKAEVRQRSFELRERLRASVSPHRVMLRS